MKIKKYNHLNWPSLRKHPDEEISQNPSVDSQYFVIGNVSIFK